MGSIALSGSGTVGLMPSACQLRPVGYTHQGARGATMIHPWTLGLSAGPGSVEIVRDMPSLDRRSQGGARQSVWARPRGLLVAAPTAD